MIAYLCLMLVIFSVNTLVGAKKNNPTDNAARCVSFGFALWTVLLLAAAL